MRKKFIFRFTTFIIILLLIISIITPAFIIKTGHREKLIEGLYGHEENSYDVVLLGSSHMNGSINPNILWNEHGITSFNYGTGGQPIDVTYYLLKEILKKQDNPIVVIDLYYLGLTDEFGKDEYIRYVLDNMKFSINKIKAIINTTPKSQWVYYFFPILKYHSRWKELQKEDFKFDTKSSYYAKGFSAGRNKYNKENLSNTSTNEKSNLPSKSKDYLYKIINLSKKENFKLVFTNAPHDYTSTHALDNWHKEPAKMFNEVAEIAKKNNIPFINYCDMIDEMNFDFKSDMNNEGHVNIWGADKLSTHLGNFLKENYELKDHRYDDKYKQWNLDYIYYSQVQKYNNLISEKDVNKYIALLKDENYIVNISCNNYTSANINTSIDKDLREHLGIKINSTNSNNYIAIINNNKVVFEEQSSSILSKELCLENNILLKTTTSSDKNMPSVIFNGKEYSNKYNKFNIAVYDKVLNKVIDSVYLSNNLIIR
ncbi:hypothetical protein [Clostridium botulinum]|uniref:hypothetical protein n=1 Tax=Clostridium botulinum TaxID=1491 RepID=UPI001E3C380C|nr:hypothetical protein [Clostridium botulinum]MCC5438269.1 hypothetical protein [Clostridium botulinum]NFR56582.1 hypothetical protein [Clostridium botulinum]